MHAYAKGELIRLNAWEGLLGSQSRLRQPKTHTEDTLRSPRWYPPVRRVALDRLDRATFPTFLRRRGLGAILVRSPFAPWGCVHGGFVHSAYLDAVPVVLTVVILTGMFTGAVLALQGGKSLLPAGVVRVEGEGRERTFRLGRGRGGDPGRRLWRRSEVRHG